LNKRGRRVFIHTFSTRKQWTSLYQQKMSEMGKLRIEIAKEREE